MIVCSRFFSLIAERLAPAGRAGAPGLEAAPRAGGRGPPWPPPGPGFDAEPAGSPAPPRRGDAAACCGGVASVGLGLGL
ncbi:hypothetical protein [Tautonia plasticadhaerens]|uniref:hypothetical protein n=1 Tax=Tautonia plasticadhaerens TaxID=2527974 RepID=UPI0011A72E74|nr:hypothetical protein [Tautonia plasticadhaerens]